jgi:hypothetical protein
MSHYSYESHITRVPERNKFAQTMNFVEDYLCNIVSKAWAEKEQNTLTYQVGHTKILLAR